MAWRFRANLRQSALTRANGLGCSVDAGGYRPDAPPMAETKLIPESELADRTGLPRRFIRSEANQGRLPFLKVGARRYFDLTVVLTALAKRQTKGGAK